MMRLFLNAFEFLHELYGRCKIKQDMGKWRIDGAGGTNPLLKEVWVYT